jgi:hypothetical protein
MVVTKTNWLGGINQLADITKLKEDEYWILINARVRKNAVEAVNLPLDVTNNLSVNGNIQDITAAGSLLVGFANGQAFYKQTNGTWQPIASFTMGSTAPRVFTALIPSSTVNFTRAVTSSTGTLTLGGPVGATPSALVVMDGVRQPWIIFPDGSSRVTGTYLTWSIATPEYVPIANFPMFYNGVLYAVAAQTLAEATVPTPTTKRNQIVRSVTGAPLNFVVAVTPTGDKTSANEAEGGALAMATNVDYNNVTCLAPMNANDGGFFVGTQNSSFLVYPDYNNLIYAEPTFRNQSITSIGPLNPDSVVDVLGDVAFVHDTGIRSFNGITQFRFEGRNAPFSGPINSLIDGITQTSAATGTHDNYALFAVTTIYGNGILWYDMLLQKFVSLDIYPGVGTILKFASTLDNGTRDTYFMTATGVYRLFGSEQKATVTLYGSEIVPSDDYKSVKMQLLRMGFNAVAAGGTVEASLFVNGQYCNRKVVTINPLPFNSKSSVSIPYNGGLTDGVFATAEINFMDIAPEGDRVGVMIRFDTDGLLISASAEVQQAGVWPKVNPFGIIGSISYETFAIIGNDGIPDIVGGVTSPTFTLTEVAQRKAVNAKIRSLNSLTKVIGTGNHNYGLPYVGYEAGTAAALAQTITPFWDAIRDKLLFVPGQFDNETAAASPLFNYQQHLRYFQYTSEYVDIFLINTGYDTGMVQTEIDNLVALGLTIADSVQFQWLKNALANSTKKHKWVVVHQPPFTSGNDFYSATNTNANLLFIQAVPFKDWGATALLAGCSALVERLNWNGLPVLISGAGGKALTTVHNPPIPQSSFASAAQGAYWEAVVSKLSVEFVCKTSTGSILDRYFQPV